MQEQGRPWEMAPLFPTETKVLAANYTWHMLSEIWESTKKVWERRADLWGDQKRSTQETASALCQEGQWQLEWWQKWPDAPKARTSQGIFFSGLLSLPRVSDHHICIILVACLGLVCLHLSSGNIFYCLCSHLAIWLVLLYSTTSLSKNYLTGGWPHT